MSHTSGIPDTRPRTEAEWIKYKKNHNSIYGNVEDYKLYALSSESLRYLTDLDSLAFEPGTAYEYQNPTFQLVLPIVERVTGERFDEWMQQNIFEPAGMRGTIAEHHISAARSSAVELRPRIYTRRRPEYK